MHGTVTETATNARAERRRRLAGIGFLMASLGCFTCIDTSAKWLAQGLPIVEITFVRYLVAFTIAAVLFNPVTTPSAWRTRHPWQQAVRGLLLLVVTAFNFIALRRLQLAETMSITFSVPFMVAILSVPLLGEMVGRRRWGAIVVGFLGVLLVTRPTPSHFDPAMGWAFAGAICNALYVIVTRRLSKSDGPASMLIFSTLLPAVLLLPLVPPVWVAPTEPLQWLLLVLMGLAGAAGHFFFAHAFARAPASVLSPFIYVQIVSMTLSGWIVFGDVPGPWTIAGGAVVVLSGLWLVQIERGRRIAAVPAAPGDV